MFSRSESSSRSVGFGGLMSMNVSSCKWRGWDERRFASGTSSIRRRSMHVVERKEDNGSEDPAGAGGGAVDSEGSVVMMVALRPRNALEFRKRADLNLNFEVTEIRSRRPHQTFTTRGSVNDVAEPLRSSPQ